MTIGPSKLRTALRVILIAPVDAGSFLDEHDGYVVLDPET